jgi:hypothetical protein
MRGKKGVDLLMVDMRRWDAEAVLAWLGPGRGAWLWCGTATVGGVGPPCWQRPWDAFSITDEDDLVGSVVGGPCGVLVKEITFTVRWGRHRSRLPSKVSMELLPCYQTAGHNTLCI